MLISGLSASGDWKESRMQQEKIVEIMNGPVAQDLLNAAIPARMAYTGLDGGPRVIPMGFYWNGEQIIMASPTNTYKVRALAENPRVALTVDTNVQPPKILLMRGTASMEIVDGVPQEYLDASRRQVGEENMAEFEVTVRSLYKQMAIISIALEWVKVIDFETTLPSAVEELVREQAG